jgi:pimeloyl-ACP methyl ester carboxylesterase
VLSTDKLALVRKWVGLYGGLAAYRDNANFYFRAARLSPDYAIEDREAIDAGGALSVGTLIETLSEADLSSIRATPFPVFMLVGRHDLTTPPQITADWLDALDAPTKKLVWFEHSAHLAPHEEPGRFLLALVQDVLPIAQRDKDRR